METFEGVAPDKIESQEDIEKGERSKEAAIVKRWLVEIKMAEKAHEDFHKGGTKVIEFYKDVGRLDTDLGLEYAHVRYNILWSTIQTVKPALYARTPKPVVERRLKNSDALARFTAYNLENCLRYYVHGYDFDAVMEAVVEDYLLPGRGQAWVRFVPHYKDEKERIRLQDPTEVPEGYELFEDDEGVFYEEDVLDYEEVVCDYVYWKDFLHGAARKWCDVPWVSKRVRLSKKDFKKRFPKVDVKEIDFTSSEAEGDDSDDVSTLKHELTKKAVVYEIWCKDTRKVYWISPDYKERPLDVQDDPLGLKDFFPCPRPLLATHTTDDLIPVSDPQLYKEILNELDIITKRISLLTRAIKVGGAYDPSCLDMKKIFSADENYFIPAQDWQTIAAAGGLRGVMDFLPVKEWAEALAILNDQKLKLLDDFYQVSGFSDIIRGAANPHETATAQQIKGRFATLRLGSKQTEVQRFVRDLIAIKGEIISELFSSETIRLASGFVAATPEQEQAFQAAFGDEGGLVRNDLLRRFRIIIETDSTVAINEDVEKEERIEFLNMMGNFLGQAIGVSEQIPEFMESSMEALKFGVRAFRTGRPLEESIENGTKAYVARKQREANEPPPPDPALVEIEKKLELERQKFQGDMAIKQQRIQADVHMNQQKVGAEYQEKMTEFQQKFALKQQDMQANWQAQQQRLLADMQKTRQQMSLDAEKARGDIQLQIEQIRQEFMLELKKMQMDGTIELQKAAIKAEGEAAKGQPLNINVQGSGKKVGKIQTMPDGSKQVTMEEVRGG